MPAGSFRDGPAAGDVRAASRVERPGDGTSVGSAADFSLRTPMHRVELLTIDLAFAIAFGHDTDSRATHGDGSILQRDPGLVRGLRDQILTLPGNDLSWGGYLAIDTIHATVVGTCGLRGDPAPDPEVEIAYHTFPAFEGRGYATEMARALLEIIWRNPAIRSVRAHTLPRPSASTRILQKLGMRHVGEGVDPVEGCVWRWRLARPSGPDPGGRP